LLIKISIQLSHGLNTDETRKFMKVTIFGKVIGAGVLLFILLFLFRGHHLMSTWSSFEKALIFGDVQTLEKELKSNPSLANKRLRANNTPLNEAIGCQHPKETIELLLKYGADINARGWPFDTTPLQAAAWAGKTEAVKALLAHKLDVNATNGDGDTALNYALVADNKEIFNLLLAAGADINHGRSALSECMVYAESCRLGWAEFLLSKGADPNRIGTSADRFLPLIQATLSGATNNVAALLRYHADPTVRYINGSDNFSPLGLALDEGYLDVALIIADASLQTRTNSVSLAAAKGELDLLRESLEKKSIAIGEKDELGFTPLHWAAEAGRMDAAELLLSSGADPNATDKIKYHPLEWAAYMGHEPLVELLAAKTQDNNQHGERLNTPLVLTAQKGHLEVVQFLLKNGADINAVNPFDRYHYSPLHFAVSSGSREMVELLLANGANVTAVNAAHQVPLHLWALSAGDPQIADLLLSKHADVNAKDQKGETPLHLAVRDGQKQAVQWLLDHKADVNAVNGNGKTPLSLLKWKNRGREIEKRKDIADLLRKYGAKE
jgi:ankyrin repeat protein